MSSIPVIDTTALMGKKLEVKKIEPVKVVKTNKKKEKKHIMKDLIVKIQKVASTVVLPEYKTKGAAGCDLTAHLPNGPIRISPYSTTMIPTGVKMEIPEGYAAYVLPRSGLSLKTPLRVSNAPGLIDSDFRGEIQVLIDNIGAGFATIQNGDRIAQLVFIKTERCRFQEGELTQTDRNTNGFGSTGTNDTKTNS